MLHYETIDAKTLELLKKIMEVDLFKNLRLVGGTALALQIGHRKSIDLDLFGLLKSDEYAILNELNQLGKVKLIQKTQNISIFTIDGIKVDIVNYTYPWLTDVVADDQLRLAGKKDIAAMKLAAITGRGTKKDFIDLYFLLQVYSLNQLLEFYKQKYHDGSVFLVLRSLAYFEDADVELIPTMMKELDWMVIKRSIVKKLTTYLNDSKNN